MEKIVLTDEQKKIVTFFGAPIRVLAGPGTGKTLCIIERIRSLIEQKKVPYAEICAITFTKAAAGELRRRLEKRGIKASSVPYVNTLHGFAMSILQKHQKRAGLKPGFKPIDNFVTRILMKDVLQELKERNITLSNSDVKIYIKAHFQSKAKAGMHTVVQEDRRRRKILDEFSKYFHDTLEFYNAIDWADILHKTVDLIDFHKDIKDEIHSRTQYLLIDEYQDLSPLEQFFVDKIIGDLKGLCIVGDDDQSIYETFRFADPQGIINFTKKHGNTNAFYISQCRRCPPEVVNCASSLIRNNEKRVKKTLVPFDMKKKGFIVSLCHKSKKAEIEWLILKIRELREKEFEYKDILILFRDGDIAKDYVRELQRAKIPLDIQLKFSNIFNSVYFTWLIATARWLVNNGNNLNLRQCLDFWKGIGSETVRQLKLLAQSSDGTLWEAITNVAENPGAFNKMRQRNKVVTFHEYMTSLKKIRKFPNIIRKFFDVVPGGKEDKGCQVFIKHLMRFKNQEKVVTLVEVVKDFEHRMESGELEDEYKQETKNIRIMTMHSAKGCESPIVIMPALEDDIVPGQPVNLEEERRLFYVSITRAKYTAYLTWACQRTGPEIHMIKGRKRLGKRKSRFLSEMGK